MQRCNPFHTKHKGLRALLYDTAFSLQQTDFASSEECNAIVEKVLAALELFEDHTGQVNDSILPALFDFEPAVVDVFKQEHATGLQLVKALEATIAAIYRTKNEAEKLHLGKRLNQTFLQFMIYNLDHMAKEEDVLNAILWCYYTDAEIQQLESRIRQNTPGEKPFFVAG